MNLRRQIFKGALLAKSDPRLLFSMLRSRMQTSLFPVPADRTIKQIGEVSIDLDFALGPQTKAMYYNAYEPITVNVMKKYLRPGDTFIDVGASIGYLSAVAASLVGESGQVHSFEPSPEDFERLQNLASKNPNFQFSMNPWAVGEVPGEGLLEISGLKWVGWNTMVPRFMRRDAFKEVRKVRVIRLDDYILERRNQMGKISLIKIDTEGYEFPVLKGLCHYFESFQGTLAPLLCEITPRVHSLMGTNLKEMANYMRSYEFRCVSLLDQKTVVDLTQLQGITDVLFLPKN